MSYVSNPNKSIEISGLTSTVCTVNDGQRFAVCHVIRKLNLLLADQVSEIGRFEYMENHRITFLMMVARSCL